MADAPIQGLRVALKLADALDTTEILSNLNLEISDLDKIRNIADAGVEESDIKSLSNLTYDIDKDLVAIFNETSTYESILSTLNDGRRRIDGNLNIAGKIVAPSFKFNKVDFDSGNAIRTVDFSTSRASAWSSFGDPVDSIFYGGDVIINGTGSSIELSSLDFTANANIPFAKRFESQVPTHKIRVNIDGLDYDLYAMKGIPIRFKGFFRSVNSTIQIDFNILNGLRPSWILRSTTGNKTEVAIVNRITSGTGTSRNSIVTYYDSSSIERDIEFYYPVDRITRIRLDDVRIYGIPTAKIDSMRDLTILNGDLIEMPDLRTIYPGLTTLNLSSNNLTRSNTVSLRTFSADVVSRIPLTLQYLILNNNTYSNSPIVPADLSVLTNLITFSVSSSTNSTRRMTGESPAIGPSVLNYNIAGNRFSSIHSSVIASDTLKSLVINSNGLSGTISTTNLSNLEYFISGANTHAIFNATNKTKLIEYSSNNMAFPTASDGNIGTNVLNNCTNLQTVNLFATNVTGALPNFSTNSNLVTFNSWDSRWQDTDANYSIAENTFGTLIDTPVRTKLTTFDLRSVLLRGPIHPEAFRGMTALKRLVISSYGTGITGNYPTSLSSCTNLTELYLISNKLTSAVVETEIIPLNFSNNKRLVVIDLSGNLFSGAFPSLRLDFLRTIQLNSNQFTSIGAPACRTLTYFNASNNLIDTVPNFIESTSISNIYLNNNPNMKYIADTFSTTTSLTRLEMINCGFTQGTINTIIQDLNTNYSKRPRRGVVINLTGNSAPSPTDEINVIISRLRRGGWTLGLST